MGEEGGAEAREALSVRRPLTIYTRGPDSPRAAASVFRNWPAVPRPDGVQESRSPRVRHAKRRPGSQGV